MCVYPERLYLSWTPELNFYIFVLSLSFLCATILIIAVFSLLSFHKSVKSLCNNGSLSKSYSNAHHNFSIVSFPSSFRKDLRRSQFVYTLLYVISERTRLPLVKYVTWGIRQNVRMYNNDMNETWLEKTRTL